VRIGSGFLRQRGDSRHADGFEPRWRRWRQRREDRRGPCSRPGPGNRRVSGGTSGCHRPDVRGWGLWPGPDRELSSAGVPWLRAAPAPDSVLTGTRAYPCSWVMPARVSTAHARKALAKVVRRTAQGERIKLTRYGRTIAVLIPKQDLAA